MYRLPTKYAVIALLMLLCVATSAQTTYPSGVTGCIARWDFTNNGTVTTLPDVSSNGHTGTPTNISTGVAFRTIYNKAATFNGTNSGALVANTTLLNPTQITMIALVNFNGFYSGFCNMSQIVSKGYPHFAAGNYGLGYGDNAFDGSCAIFSPNNNQLGNQFGNVSNSSTPGNYVQTNKWYFCAASYNGTTVKYYQVEMDTAVFQSVINPYLSQTIVGTIGTNAQDVSIGYHLNPTYPYWVNGRMDELILFNKQLTDSEIHSVYEYLWGRLTVSTNDTNLCSTSSLTVNYTTYNPDHYVTGNVFTAQLSDAFGSFAFPVNIGSVASITSGSIACTIPLGTPVGSGYRVRVVASNVPFISSDNGVNIIIGNLLSSLSLGNDTAICSGTSFTLTPTGAGTGSTYQWSTGSTASSIIVNAPGTYWVTVANGNCTGSDTMVVTQATSLNVNLGNDVTICPGQSANLFPAIQPLGATYLWSNMSTSSTISVNTAGTYWLTVTNGSCTGSDTVNVIQASALNVNLGNDTMICPGQALSLSAGTQPVGATYLWSNGATTSSITVTTGGNYWLTVTAGACTGSDAINVTLGVSPDVDLGNDIALCAGQSATLTPATQPVGATYLWNTTATTPTINVNTGGAYTLTVTDGGCTGNDTIVVTSIPPINISLGNDITICEGQSTVLTPSGQTSGLIYLWNTGATGTSISVSAAGTYWVTASATGCSDSDTIVIAEQPSPDVNLGNDTTICEGAPLTLSSTQPTGSTYLWSTGDSQSALMVNATGTYSLTVTYNGCSATDEIHVVELSSPLISLGRDTTLCSGQQVLLPQSITAIDPYSIAWQDGSIQNSLWVKTNGLYIATITNACGSYSDTVLIQVGDCNFWFPGAFSPNGDNLNDKARLLGTLNAIDDFTMHIYNRFGNLVYMSDDKYAGWDGNYKGKAQQVGVYFYQIQFKFKGEPTLLKGDITLLR
jgi:gliding motility-associated-like protein